MANREKLSSRLGFILVSAGCAIGIGNVWKFPYLVGQFGGGIFVLIYLLFLLIMGVPAMTMEFALGRASQKSPVKLFNTLEKPGQKWHIHGYVCLAANYLIIMFYAMVSGWMLKYFVDMASGKLEGLTSESIESAFNYMLSQPQEMIIYMGIIVIVGFFICSKGVVNGLEKITKVMMLALLIIMITLATNSIFLDGAKEGLKFYVMPSLKNIEASGGIFNVIVAAMNQAFFTLSIGIGSMAIFGSYLNKDRSLLGESLPIALLDTFVAISSGLIIFPACFSYNVAPDSGPSLIFITLPNIFNNLPMGKFWGSLFFLFLTFAAFSTILAIFENISSCFMELTGFSRKKSCLINGILLFILSVPCILGFNVWSGFMPFGEGSNIMDLEDFIVSNVALPIGSLVFVLFCVTRYGYGWNNFVEEANQGKGLKIKKWMRGYMTFVLPTMVIAVFIIGIIQKFFI